MDPVLMVIQVADATYTQASAIFREQINDAIPNDPRVTAGAQLALKIVEDLIEASQDDEADDLTEVREALKRRVNG